MTIALTQLISWFITGLWVNQQPLTLMSLLNSKDLLKVGVTARQRSMNSIHGDRVVCVSMVVEAYGTWGQILSSFMGISTVENRSYTVPYNT